MTAISTGSDDFSKGDHAASESIGSHSLFLRVSGPPRHPGDPVIIIEAGHSDGSLTWPAVQRHISQFARVCSYDRAGYGYSEPSSSPITGREIAEDLVVPLPAADIEPPYLLVGHSYSGILIREFFALLQPAEVARTVLVDANQRCYRCCNEVRGFRWFQQMPARLDCRYRF